MRTSPPPILTPSVLMLFFAAALVTALMFAPWMPVHFIGDDLANRLEHLQGAFPGDIASAFSHTTADKYRPVSHLAMGTLFRLFEDSVRAYLFFNVLLHAFSAVLVYLITWHLTNYNRLLALLAAVLIATSRFGLYQVTQVTGLVEGLGFMFFLAALLAAVRAPLADAPHRIALLVWSAGFALLAFLSHERYVVFVAWLALLIALRPGLLGVARHRLVISGALVASIPLYFAIKGIALGSPGLVGTDGRALMFDQGRALKHAAEALFSVFGLNHGPDYLVGVSGVQLGLPYVAAALIIAAAWVGSLVLAVHATWRAAAPEQSGSTSHLEWTAALLILALVMLAPMLATSRLEQRWLVQPFALTVVAFCASLAIWRGRRTVLAACLATTFVALQFALNAGYARRLDSFSLVYAHRFAQEIDRFARATKHPSSIAILGAQEHCEWTLQGGRFFELRYGSPVRLTCVSSVAELLSATVPAQTRFLRQTKLDGGLIDMSAEVAQARFANQGTLLIDLVAAFPQGRVSPDIDVDTPSRRGTLTAAWESSLGPVPSVTVVSGFRHSYANVRIEKPASFRALAAMVYPSSAGAVALLRARRDGQPAIEQRVLLRPRSKAGEWFPETVELTLDAPGNYTLELETLTPPGQDPSGHWIAYFLARVAASSP